MEKLQAAIQKAREKRESAGAADPTQLTGGRAPTVVAKDKDPSNGTRPLDGSTPSGSSQMAEEDGQILDARWHDLSELSMTTRQASRNRLFLEGATIEGAYFDKLRTKVLQQCRDNGWRRVLITSATKSCGKTTIASNLAASFGRQSDRRVILLELDMRRPGMTKLFRHSPDCGLSDILEGNDDFSGCAVRLGANVAIAMNREPHPNPSELLLRDRTPEILAEIEANYAPDLVIFDTPPLLATDDTLALLKYTDCALIVAAAEKTTTHEIDTVEKEIAEQTNVMGVILNQCVYMDRTDSYYHYR
ncbi:MAG: CpsD/CapB family tyrosine-protein kinase [Pseudomonadota bacterium]